MSFFFYSLTLALRATVGFQVLKSAEVNCTTEVQLNGTINLRHKHSKLCLAVLKVTVLPNGKVAFSRLFSGGNDGSKGLSYSHTIQSDNTDANQANGRVGVFIYLVDYLLPLKLIFAFN